MLIGENTEKLVKGSFLLREIDFVRVKGKEKPVRIYELLGESNTVLPEKTEKAFHFYAEGLDAYRSQCWSDAIKLFEIGQELYNVDKTFEVMSLRCRINQRQPPQTDWDGAFRERRK
jgi:adenylate cyclase